MHVLLKSLRFGLLLLRFKCLSKLFIDVIGEWLVGGLLKSFEFSSVLIKVYGVPLKL